jgi:hypothetical protein
MNLTALPQFLVEIAGYGHGPMHVNLGGVFGACSGAMTKLYKDNQDEMQKVWTMADISAKVSKKLAEPYRVHISPILHLPPPTIVYVRPLVRMFHNMMNTAFS